MSKTHVLMVCLGNICRSPLAEGILKSKVNPEKVVVDSAGTSAQHKGELPDPRSIDVAKKYGIDITDQRSRPFTISDFEKFDKIFVMDRENYQHVLALSPTKEASQKVQLILNTLHASSDAEVPDPYYGGERGFENVYAMLEKACQKIANQLQEDAHA